MLFSIAAMKWTYFFSFQNIVSQITMEHPHAKYSFASLMTFFNSGVQRYHLKLRFWWAKYRVSPKKWPQDFIMSTISTIFNQFLVLAVFLNPRVILRKQALKTNSHWDRIGIGLGPDWSQWEVIPSGKCSMVRP